MKRMIVVLAVMLCATFLSISEKAVAAPIDRFIGQIATKKTAVFIKINDESKRPLFPLYHGDVLIMERNNIEKTIYIVGLYRSTTDALHDGDECSIPLQRTNAASLGITINIIINEEKVLPCNTTAH